MVNRLRSIRFSGPIVAMQGTRAASQDFASMMWGFIRGAEDIRCGKLGDCMSFSAVCHDRLRYGSLRGALRSTLSMLPHG